MAMDYAARRQARDEANELLKSRYNEGEDFTDPVPVMRAVRVSFAQAGRGAPEAPLEDVLAALTMVDDARTRLDALEHDLLRAARSRDAS